MTDLEKEIVYLINEHHRKYIYRNENYQLFHNVKYRKQMSKEYLELIRKKY